MSHLRTALPWLRAMALALPLASLERLRQPARARNAVRGHRADRAALVHQGDRRAGGRCGGQYLRGQFRAQANHRQGHPGWQGEVFLTLPGASIANGIRFGSRGQMYLADYIEHTIYGVDPVTRAMTIHAREAA